MATIKDLANRYGVAKAQDQNENLGRLAEMLGSARDIGNEYKVPSWVPLAGGTGAGDLLMGRTPEEIENWSYGNAPMQIPEMSNVPQFKRGRAQSLADALTTLAPGVKATEGLPAGLSFIGPKSRNWDKVAAELAAKKLDEGADPAEVWREHLIGRMPDKTLFSEISDKDALYHEHGKDFYDSTLNKTNQLLKHGRDTAGYPLNVQDMLAHPNFYENYPNLEATELRYLPETSTAKGGFGHFEESGDPVLSIHGMLPNNQAKSTMLHELQHGIQRDEGWGQGGSPQEFTRQKEAEHARDVLNWRNEVLARKKKNPDADTNAIENSIIKDYSDMGLFNDFVPSREARELATQPYMMYPERYDHTNEFEKLNNLVGEYGLDKRTTPYTPIEGYKRLAGEAQARATQDRLDMDMAQRRENYPLAGGKLSDIPLEDLIYKYEGNGPSLSADPLSKYKDYVGEHSAPLGDSGAPLHNLTANENAIYPSDVYSSQANQYYGSGEPEDAQLFAMAQRLKDKPNEKVSIYRAVPKMQSNSEKAAQLEKDLANYMKRGRMPSNSDFNNKSDWYEWASNERDRLASLPEETLDPLSINHGDWVALDKKYAKEHGESALGGNYKILSKKVPARQLFTNGDSIREWGWDSRYAKGGEVDIRDDEGGKVESAVEDYKQLLSGYPNAEKFFTGLKDAAYRSVPTTEQMRDPNFIIDNAGIGGIIKPKGGNWLDTYGRSPEKAAKQFGKATVGNPNPSEEINNWLQQKLGKYIQNELGTPEDPIRRIAEEWPAKRDVLISQQQSKIPNLKEIAAKYEDMGLPPEVIASRMANAQRETSGIQDKISELEGYNPLHYKPRDPGEAFTQDVQSRRIMAGYPAQGIAKSDLGKLWEHYADENISAPNVSSLNRHDYDRNPWLGKLNNEDTVYAAGPMIGTGFDKLADELRKATRPDTDLPDFLRIDPAKLRRVSMPQAVEHVAKINAWRDAEKLKEGRNTATVMHKEYPDQGLSWMQMKMPEPTLQEGHYLGEDNRGNPSVLDPSGSAWSSASTPEEALAQYRDAERRDALKAALKFEGDTMGHCVGQYCDEVGRGDSNIYSLRDRRGEPHVTIETKGGGFDPEEFLSLNKDLLADPWWENRLKQLHSDDNQYLSPQGKIQTLMNEMRDSGETFIQPKPMERIVQIKGKQNEAPVAKYLPAVQDFVRSKDWSMVHDLPNSGLLRLQKYKNNLSDDIYNQALEKHGPYVTQDELNHYEDLTGNYAKGGEVKDLHSKYEESDYGYGNRPDKTKKGLGYFGELERPDGTGVMTEYSIGVPIHGKEMDIPTLVPTLTPEEVQHILNIKEGERIPRSIVNKAIDHAHKRIKEDKPVFATEKDLYADGGSVVGDLPFNDPDQLRLYHQAMKHYDDVIENTGGSKKMGKTEARINYNTTTKGDRDRDKDLHTLIADYGIDVGKDAKINATMIKPMEAEGVYLGNLTGSVPVGEGRASLGLQGLHTKYSDGLSGYTAGYNGKVGGGDLSASYFEPADHNSAGRQVQLEYSMPFADGGSVSEFEDPAHERLYRRAMAHFDNLVNS